MIAINKARVETLIKKYKKTLDSQNKQAYDKLEKLFTNNSLSHKETKYLRLILNKFKDYNLVTVSVDDIKLLVNEIGKNPSTKKRIFSGNKKETHLKDEILKALSYTEKRSSFYPLYFNHLGIKSCVYCNCQPTLNIEKTKVSYPKKNQGQEYIARYEVDHFYPQSKYPYLGIALFNLYPVCSSCNSAKSKDPIEFQLYKDVKTIDYDLMGFKLDLAKKARFLISRDVKDIAFTFHNKESSSYDEIFHISQVYETQKDIAEEIILKSLAYDNTLRNHLKKIGNINDALINKMILGNYTNIEDVHKRPLAKFMQDIAKEVGLINRKN